MSNIDLQIMKGASSGLSSFTRSAKTDDCTPIPEWPQEDDEPTREIIKL